MSKFHIKKVFKLDHDITLSVPFWQDRVTVKKPMHFYRNGKKYMTIRNNGLIDIYKGYTWDGCSPKFRIFGKKIGTYDGPYGSDGHRKCYFASLLHDCLYEALHHPRRPFVRKDADRAFHQLMKAADYKFAIFYYMFVRIFGGIAHKISRPRAAKITVE